MIERMPAAQFSIPEDAASNSLLLAYFRERGQEALAELQRETGARNPNALAAAINKALKNSTRQVVESISRAASSGSWSPEQKLVALLASTYSGQVAMLELRNEIRPYDKVWVLVDSGQINLELDLHCIVSGERFNIDLKSSFGSNERGTRTGS